MDVEVIGAGRASTWRRGAEDEEEEEDAGGGVGGGGGGGGVEAQIVPLDLYDSARAKIEANLRWLFAKAYGIDNIPPDLQDPFYTDQYEQEHIKPPIIHLLLSGELYCRVCGLILHAEQAASLQSHQSVLQALSRKGIYVLESDNTQVSDVDLSSAPIKMSSHVHLIDALMMAYMVEMISIEKVVSSVKRFSNLSASKELPLDLEDAMVFWINKVNMKMKEMTEKELKMKQHLLEPSGHQKVRYRRDHLSGRALQHFPLLDDLLKDVCDGMALLALIHFYCPDLIRLEDICLKEVPSIADSLYNIELLREFSNSYLNRCFCLKPEDVLYSPPVLKNNVMVFIAELFWWFESVKPGFVQPRGLQEIRDARLLLKPKGAQSQVSSSNVTKSAFMSSSNSADVLTEPTGPDLSIKSGSLSPSQSSVPFRQRQQKTLEENLDPRNRSYSVTRGDGQHLGSVGVWPERRPRPLSQPVPYALHYPVEDDVDSLSLARSISKDSLSSNILSMTPKHMLGSGAHRSHHRLSGQSLLSHMRIEDEEEEIEEEELVAVIHPHELSQQRLSHQAFTPSRQVNSCYTEPLMPAVLKPAKEKSISLNKQEESGESPLRTLRAARRAVSNATSPSENKPPIADSSRNTFTPIPAAEPLSGPLRLPPERRAVISPSEEKQPQGFFLHLSAESDYKSPYSSTLEVGYDSDSDIADLEEDEEEDDELGITREVKKMEKEKGSGAIKGFESGEGESAKLREDSKVTERDDKEDGSGCSSPCLSTISWASSCSASGSAGVRMTSFAERKLLKLGLCEGVSSTSSSQKTTPDGSEFTSGLPWHLKVDSCLGKDSNVEEKLQIMPSELLQLHMQLEEQRRAIEHQKKKMETLSACQRLKLGKAAFLNIVKKGAGKSDTLPLPLRQPSKLTTARVRSQLCRDDSCLDTLKAEVRTSQPESRQLHKDTGNALTQGSSESGLNECSRSIDLLNEAISSIQEQMLQLSAQQNLLMKKNVASPTECGQSGPSTTPTETQTTPPTSDPRSFSVHFDICDNSSFPVGRPPRLSSSLRGKATNRKPNKEKSQQGLNSNSSLQTSESTPSSSESISGDQETGSGGESSRSEGGIQRNSTFRVTEEQSDISRNLPQAAGSKDDEGDDSRKEALGGDESSRVKGQLIEVDLSELKESRENGGPDSTAEGEQKNSLGFFFKDEEKAEDEMAKRRAAFLLKQQRKAEEARLRKQQQESESELRRDEARRKAEEDRIRKEEEKARRELIKQEYLQRKQQALIEEQGLAKPRPRTKSRKHRPKSLHREEFNSLTKGGTARMKTIDLSCSHRGSTLSLATEADSVISGDAESQRAGSVCSVESFPVLSRASSRNMERDWESGSIASSITSSEYSGPKLFKEPSSKSNKPIIINAIAHCCLAGKVNETQKNVILEELEKCESNHLIILFRDGGCQFRAIYAYSPETEEIIKFTGTGPRSITHKMVDKVYKYSSDRKQFTIIPAKSVSVSVDALTIHNHLWQVKRTGSALRK